jgi:chromosome segregation ATPase
MEKTKDESTKSEVRFNVRFERLKEDHERLKKKLSEVTELANAKEIALTKVENSVIAKQTRIDALKKRIEGTAARVTDVETQIKEVRQAYNKCGQEKAELNREIRARENKLQKIGNLLRTYEEELFSRDTEVMDKTSAIQQLQR